jgi:hypothetical protein
MKGVGRFI